MTGSVLCTAFLSGTLSSLLGAASTGWSLQRLSLVPERRVKASRRSASDLEWTKGKITLWCCGGGNHAFWYALGKGALLRHVVHRIEGASAGAMAACLIACLDIITLDDIVRAYEQTQEAFAARLGELGDVIHHFLDQLLPADAHLRLQRKVGIVMSEPGNVLKGDKPFRGKIVDRWSSRDSLIRCVIASAFIPGIVGFQHRDPVYNCIDGGMCSDYESLSTGKYLVARPNESVAELVRLERFRKMTVEKAMNLYDLGYEVGAFDQVVLKEACMS